MGIAQVSAQQLMAVPQSTSVAEHVQSLENIVVCVPQAEGAVIHRFAPGLYIREVRAPGGILAIGHYQKTEHLNVFLKGKVTVINDDGSTTDLSAPMMFIGKPGRKCGYIHEEMIWQNIYPTTETDVEKIEESILSKSAEWKTLVKDRLEIARLEHESDREDYRKILGEVGYTEEMVQSEVQNVEDQVSWPMGSYKCIVSSSPIHGKGLFATAPIESGESIALGRIDGKRTPAGRYTNHSVNPNAGIYVLPNGDLKLIAIRDLKGCHGGVLGDEITIDYRHALRLRGAKNV